MKTEEGNKLIAIFAGAVEEPLSHKYNPHIYFSEDVAPPIGFINEDRRWDTKKEEYRVALLDLQNLQYHTSWDWLMPIVQKIQESYEGEELHEESCKHYEQIEVMLTSLNIEWVWQACVMFIEWFNQQNLKIKPTPNSNG